MLRETDPLGHVTRYTYHALNGVKTIQDPLGHVTTNDYDANGNLLSTADPLGNVTTYGYDKGDIIYPGSGLMTSKTDALGNKTRYNYDAQGRMTTETDPQATSPPMITTPTATVSGKPAPGTAARKRSSLPSSMTASTAW